MNKHDINLEKQAFNTLFSETYISICMWLPWIVLTILVFTTIVDRPLKTWILASIVWVIILNGLYMIHRFTRYKLIKKASSN